MTLAVRTYFSVGRLRADCWATVEAAALRVVEGGSVSPDDAVAAVDEMLASLDEVERFFAVPGLAGVARVRAARAEGDWQEVSDLAGRVRVDLGTPAEDPAGSGDQRRPRFDVLVVEGAREPGRRLEQALRDLRRPSDEFAYDAVSVASMDEALLACIVNGEIEAVAISTSFTIRPARPHAGLDHLMPTYDAVGVERLRMSDRAVRLASEIARLRPEIDLYLVSSVRPEHIAGLADHEFDRVFHGHDDFLDLHHTILQGVSMRFATPFFSALRHYSQRPVGVFHALPVARAQSVLHSMWARDMAEFYGPNLLLAETSATAGGLDSLLEPHGPLRAAQDAAARAFGARRTYFVTNGTSTANKVVVQALVRPGDIVLVDRNCHKSHHYGLVLAGAYVSYLDPYPLPTYGLSGAVALDDVLAMLRRYRDDGVLDRVRLLMLTNCTFDGIVYDPLRVMQECLAIHPDLVFLWDEAWFAHARLDPIYRRRTAMDAARVLSESGRTARVYATQSTHKTLTALRQGSMIHVWDDRFADLVERSFSEAYMTHTSTSPNYQILASLDIGRRQVELEGFRMLQRQVELAMGLWERVSDNPVIERYLRFLTTEDMVPERFRTSGIALPLAGGRRAMEEAWRHDELVLDPTRLNLSIGASGVDGTTFKTRLLMNDHAVQVNKTSQNTVLFMTNIGTTRSAVSYLIEVLVSIARELERGSRGRGAFVQPDALAPPPFTAFAPAFRRTGAPDGEGDVRSAFFLAYDSSCCEAMTLSQARRALEAGRTPVSASFVTPYPPGFPVLVPGQEVDDATLAFLSSLDTPEIHGYDARTGLRVFTPAAVTR